jgi:thioredoxin-like negative regulator of GroEL
MSRNRLSSPLPREKNGVEISHRRAEGVFLKLAFGGLFGFVLLIAVVWGGHGVYVRWQERRLIQKAEESMNRGDSATASLAARAVLQMKPESVPANRIAAEISERNGDAGALVWRRKLAQAPNHSMEDVLALARAALQFNDVATARQSVAQVAESERASGGYHAVVAMIAQVEKQNETAEKEWAEALRYSPEEKSYQLQLGAARLRLTDPAKRDAGTSMLNSLRSDAKFRAPATRILVSEAIARHKSVGEIQQLVRELNSYSESTFSDAVMMADVLRQTNDREFALYLPELEKKAAGNGKDLVMLLSWMNQSSLNLLALDFLKTVNPELLKTWPVPMAVADIYVRLQEWTHLEQALNGADWRNFEFARHAYMARALRGEDKSAGAEREWSLATKGAAVGSEPTMMLLRLTAMWGWRAEETDLLWALTKYPDKEKEAIQALYVYYQKNRDSQGLYRVLVRLTEDNPGNLDTQNNLAQISLLLDVKTQEARRMAAEVYHKVPGNPAYATTYAYALLTKGDTQAAAKVMATLSEEQLKDPAVSAYYGLCLAAVKDPRAGKFLDAGDKAKLLPEERVLLDKARTSIRGNTVLR